MKITKHAQSCFLVETKTAKFLVDPGTYVFEDEGLDPYHFGNINAIIITHEHSDHFDYDHLRYLIESEYPTIYATEPVVEFIKDKYASINTKILKEGMVDDINGIKIIGFDSTHGPLPNGKPAPITAGVMIDDGITSFYSPGDSVLLNPKASADVIGTPICGQVVMDISTARSELSKLSPKIAIPMHYDNPNYPVDVNDFYNAMDESATKVIILDNGESIDV